MSALREVPVPDIGDFKDVLVIEILVMPGDRVAKDDPLVVLESEKATFDVPSPESGLVRALKVVIGDRVSVGSTLLTLDVASAESPIVPQMRIAAADAPCPPPGRVSGATPSEVGTRRGAYASPSTRRFARELGIDLTAVEGTGPRGRIVKEDLRAMADAARPTPIATAVEDTFGGLKLTPWPQVDFAKFGRVERAPLSRIRKISGAFLTRNSIVIPHVTNFAEADITDLDAFRRTLNEERRTADAKTTILAFLIKMTASTLAKYEEFNSSLDGDDLVLKRYFHIGFAADTPNGLIVPIIRDVDTKGVSQIASEAAMLAARARDGKLAPTDMQGASFTISSLGGISGTGFTPIINAPEVAILGVAHAQMRPVWNGTDFRPRLILPLMLSWDHRVIDGVAAARFLSHLSGLLSDTRRLLL